MVRRTTGTIKDPDNPQGVRIPVDLGIMKFLKDGGRQIIEILKHVQSNEPKPTKYTEMGIRKILRRLEGNEQIKKQVEGGYRKYYLTDMVVRDVTLQTILFSKYAQQGLLNKFSSMILGMEESFLKSTVEKIGIYHIYVYLKSWDFFYNEKSPLTSGLSRLLWLQGTLPIDGFSYYMDQQMVNLSSKTQKNPIIERIEFEDGKGLDSKKKLQLENLLRKLYPMEMDFLDELWHSLPKTLKNTKNEIDAAKQFNRIRKKKQVKTGK